MKILRQFLKPNEYSRPQKALKEFKGIVIHWTANPNANAMQNLRFFENRKAGMSGYGSAHYIIGQDGEIIQAIPDKEIAYHVGSSDKDPASGKIYTDYARKKYGKYAINYKSSSPNLCTIGIELCPTDNDGNFTDATINAAIELCAYLIQKHDMKTDDITTHHDIVGWKDCPKLWTEHPQLLGAFKASVAEKIQRG